MKPIPYVGKYSTGIDMNGEILTASDNFVEHREIKPFFPRKGILQFYSAVNIGEILTESAQGRKRIHHSHK